MAALAVGLFALLVGLLTENPWIVLVAGFVVSPFQPRSNSMAASIAEVVPALAVAAVGHRSAGERT